MINTVLPPAGNNKFSISQEAQAGVNHLCVQMIMNLPDPDIYERASASGIWHTVKEPPISSLIEKPGFTPVPVKEYLYGKQ